MQSDVAALCERLKWHHEHPVTGKLVLINPDGPEAANRLESLSHQLSDAQRERDELRAAVSAARAEIKGRSEMAYEQKAGGVGQGLGEAWRVIDKHIPAEHTEGGKP